MPTRDEILALIQAHSDDARVADRHVLKLWEDGEITSEKGGDLYGARSLHKLEYSIGDLTWVGEEMPHALDLDLLPHKTTNGHAYMIASHEGVFAVRRAIWPTLPEVSLSPPPRPGEEPKTEADAFKDMNERRRALFG